MVVEAVEVMLALMVIQVVLVVVGQDMEQIVYPHKTQVVVQLKHLNQEIQVPMVLVIQEEMVKELVLVVYLVVVAEALYILER